MTEPNLKQLAKLMIETKLPWTKFILIVLLQIRMAPRKDVVLSLDKMLYGLPYLGQDSELPTRETKDQFHKNYMLAISATLLSLRLKCFPAQTSSLEFNIHSTDQEIVS